MPELSDDHLYCLRNALSTLRFATYLLHSDNCPNRAHDLYQWNMEISSGMMIPLHVVEVVFRNAVAEAISSHHGENWPWAEGFLRSIRDSKESYDPRRNIISERKGEKSIPDIIANLNFIFWEKMLIAKNVNRIWNKKIPGNFPKLSRRRIN